MMTPAQIGAKWSGVYPTRDELDELRDETTRATVRAVVGGASTSYFGLGVAFVHEAPPPETRPEGGRDGVR